MAASLPEEWAGWAKRGTVARRPTTRKPQRAPKEQRYPERSAATHACKAQYRPRSVPRDSGRGSILGQAALLAALRDVINGVQVWHLLLALGLALVAGNSGARATGPGCRRCASERLAFAGRRGLARPVDAQARNAAAVRLQHCCGAHLPNSHFQALFLALCTHPRTPTRWQQGVQAQADVPKAVCMSRAAGNGHHTRGRSTPKVRQRRADVPTSLLMKLPLPRNLVTKAGGQHTQPGPPRPPPPALRRPAARQLAQQPERAAWFPSGRSHAARCGPPAAWRCRAALLQPAPCVAPAPHRRLPRAGRARSVREPTDSELLACLSTFEYDHNHFFQQPAGNILFVASALRSRPLLTSTQCRKYGSIWPAHSTYIRPTYIHHTHNKS